MIVFQGYTARTSRETEGLQTVVEGVARKLQRLIGEYNTQRDFEVKFEITPNGNLRVDEFGGWSNKFSLGSDFQIRGRRILEDLDRQFGPMIFFVTFRVIAE